MSSFTFKCLRRSTLVVATILLCGVAKADLIDQVNLPGPVDYTTNSTLAVAQSFTVGLTGQLTKLEVYVSRDVATTSDLSFDVRTLSGALPSEPNAGSNVLASLTRSAGVIPTTAGWQTFDISGAGVNVNTGDTLAIVLRNDQVPGYQWLGAGSDPYDGGSTFFRVGPGVWGDDPFAKDTDLGFRTFVAIPEPSSLAIFSLVGLACVRRRRR